MSTEPADLPDLSEQAIEWLVRLRSGNLSDTETHVFADWLSTDIDHAKAFAEAEDLYNGLTLAAAMPRNKPNVDEYSLPSTAEPDLNTAALSTIGASNYLPAYGFKKTWLTVPLALATAWLIAVGLILPDQSHPLDRLLSDYHTGTGEQRAFNLVDGSQLLLNTNTAVSVNYQANLRQITLHHGQARFTVAKDSRRPFEVSAGNVAIRALGTVFEVYQPSADALQVTVQEHAVEARLTGNAQTATVRIEENQQLSYDATGRFSTPKRIAPDQTGAWQQGKIYIHDRPLSELIAELERYRTGRIFLSDTALKNLRVVGVFNLSDPEAVINKICQILDLKTTRLGPWWVVLHR